MKIGDRVGAVQKSNAETVCLFGYGEYIGDSIPTRGFLGTVGIENPTIRLDNGQVVYGFECWWGSEEKVKSMIGDRKIEIVSMEN
jgi:hypothetical protein